MGGPLVYLGGCNDESPRATFRFRPAGCSARISVFTCVPSLALTLGIGGNTLSSASCTPHFLAPLPYPNPDQLVIVWSKVKRESQRRLSRRLFGLEAAEHCLQDLCAWTGGNYSLSTSDHPEMIQTR